MPFQQVIVPDSDEKGNLSLWGSSVEAGFYVISKFNRVSCRIN